MRVNRSKTIAQANHGVNMLLAGAGHCLMYGETASFEQRATDNPGSNIRLIVIGGAS